LRERRRRHRRHPSFAVGGFKLTISSSAATGSVCCLSLSMSITAHHWPAASRSLFTDSEGINSSKYQCHLPKADSRHIIPSAMDQLVQPKSFSKLSI
jgi:hypothetical protein